jgi:hypothetical protein
MNPPRTPARLWTERYETIRRHFLEKRPLLSAEPLGLALLRHHGLAGWMRRWRLESATTPQPPGPSPEPPVLPVISLWQQELTGLLAHMTAQHLQPIHT